MKLFNTQLPPTFCHIIIFRVQMFSLAMLFDIWVNVTSKNIRRDGRRFGTECISFECESYEKN
jgi:hypothetical protein